MMQKAKYVLESWILAAALAMLSEATMLIINRDKV
jgi:hypothetical protein